ncbi:hypothetical protein SACS_0842 [Parasaccharibacter apium]|uniref:Uncharacterized protein n=1 Tax=Parasaccharibacter apium TaxID=1510841 RepID=A0A7U7G5L7_9PROT|nr:hypothetical protein SACS_0842 [Parasaccharibacter apium]
MSFLEARTQKGQVGSRKTSIFRAPWPQTRSTGFPVFSTIMTSPSAGLMNRSALHFILHSIQKQPRMTRGCFSSGT